MGSLTFVIWSFVIDSFAVNDGWIYSNHHQLTAINHKNHKKTPNDLRDFC
ncbi:hypothetical protein EJK55_0777 [Moraxella catarrhalis]|nr:hypothetical protein EJK55_0777 [Moraxella catarrhalis]